MAEKDRFVILFTPFNILFFKIENDKLIPVEHKFTPFESNVIPSKVIYKNNFHTLEFTNMSPMKYPSFVCHYYDEFALTHYEKEHIHDLPTRRIVQNVNTFIKHLDKIYPGKKEITFYSYGFHHPHYDIINTSIKSPYFKGMCNFTFEISSFLHYLLKQNSKNVFMVTDITVEKIVDHLNTVEPLLKHFEEIEKIIRNKYYFLSKYENNNVSDIAVSFFYELYKNERAYECIYQDTSILFTEEEYQQIEDLIVDSYYNSIKQFNESYPNSIYVNNIQSEVGKKLFNKALERLENNNLVFINLQAFLPMLCEYHRLNYFASSCMNNKVKHLNYSFQYKMITDSFFERNKYITKEESLNIKQKVELLKEKSYNKINSYFEKEGIH